MYPIKTFISRFKNPIFDRLAKGAFWSLASFSLSKSAELVAFTLIARILKNQKFGEFSMVLSTISMFKVFAWVWVGNTVTKYVAEFRHDNCEKASRIISLTYATSFVFGGGLALILFLLSDWISAHFLAAPQLSLPLKLSAIAIFLGSLTGVQNGILAGFENFRTLALINFIIGLITLPVLLMGAQIKGINGAVIGLGLVQFINILLNQLYLKKVFTLNKIQHAFSTCIKEIKILWEFSLPAFISGAVVTLASWICNAILANQANGYSELGIFNAANQWRNAIIFIPTAIGASILPVLTNLYQKNEIRTYKKVLFYNILLNMLVAGVIALPIILFPALIMKTFGSSFEAGQNALLLLAVTAILNSAATIVGQSVASLNKMWWGAGLNLLWALILITFAWYFIDKGAYGVALAYLIAYAINFISITFFIYFRLLMKGDSDHTEDKDLLVI